MRPNPKDEAEDLLYQMRYDHMSGTLTKKKAKQCAKIAVEYLIANEHLETGDESWWEQVKQELENLK